jgi:hypothetical protein
MLKENTPKKVSKKELTSTEETKQTLKLKKFKDKDVTKKKFESDNEPTLFHYTIVLLILGTVFGILYMGFEFYDEKTNEGAINNPNLKIKLYKYPFIVDGNTYSIQFYNPISDLEKSDLKIGITKDELLSTQNFKFIFSSNSSSNGEVVKISGRLFPFLKNVYMFPLNSQKDIISSNNLTCKNSTIDTKLIFFNSNSTTNELVYDNLTGCIIFKTTNSNLMGTLGDKFFLDIINSK